jgi:hypothetical protein
MGLPEVRARLKPATDTECLPLGALYCGAGLWACDRIDLTTTLYVLFSASMAIDEERQPKRTKRDSFQLEPSYVSIPMHPVLLFDAIGDGGVQLPRLTQRSTTLFDLDGERGLLGTFACNRCKDISSTTSSVPCRCGVLCDICKTKSHWAWLSNENEFGCIFCSIKYPPKAGHELCPPLSSYSRRIGGLFEWVVDNCAATCPICSESHKSIRTLHSHLPNCTKQRLKLCRSISCLRPINCDDRTPHQCMYDQSVAKKYGQVGLPCANVNRLV